MNYRVVKAVRRRVTPSFYASGNGDAYLGEFSTDTPTVTNTEEIPKGGPEYTTTWVSYGKDWIPFKHYKTDEVYVVELSVEPPPVDPPVEPPTEPEPDSIKLTFSEATIYDQFGAVIAVTEGGEITLKVV